MDHDYGQLLALPPHVQRLENSLKIDHFLSYVERIISTPNDSISDSSSDNDQDSHTVTKQGDSGHVYNGVTVSKAERKSDKNRLYNFKRTKRSRKWLKAVLCCESSSDEDEDAVTDADMYDMLSLHNLQKKHSRKFYQNPDYCKYKYYSCGLLSNYDLHTDHFKKFDTSKSKIKFQRKIKESKKNRRDRMMAEDGDEEDDSENDGSIDNDHRSMEAVLQRRKQSKKTNKVKKMTPEQALAKRHKIFISISKKEIPRAHKQKISAQKEVLANLKKLSHQCMRERRRAAIQSQKISKEATQRAKRLAREMLAYWKRFEKVEREHRRKAEKEAQEQRKIDVELREARRQQRKLNFLITQTELYAHFMARKMTGATDADRDRILSHLDDAGSRTDKREVIGGVLQDINDVDQYDSDQMKKIALQNAELAYSEHHSKQELFSFEASASINKMNFTNPSISSEAILPQPSMFNGILKGYQLKGMNWLVNLYNQGINGILADEMGLGKTVQTIALLGHLAETNGIWGPFLIVAPASTLHNWQQECERFIPRFRAVPYWGNSQDRRILRKFWDNKGQQNESSSFHVAITSYQLIVQDVKYFQRIKWQYMVLDEAQAIKSSSSVRWKILLGFNCRNRLLLTGTPIQNSMAELWALLHFIMPTLFDSHQEFNEWFSKDIESSVEKQSNIDEHQLSRLHMILNPFMLRRVKKDVENELSDKIEITVCCPLTIRQRRLYQAIKNKISIEDLLHSSTANSTNAQNTTSNLMNIVMHFRKVCNHPELFERRDQQTPFYLEPPCYYIPKLIYREGIISKTCDRHHIIYNLLYLFTSAHIHRSLFHHQSPVTECRMFSFIRFIDLSPAQLHSLMLDGLLVRWLSILEWYRVSYLINHIGLWSPSQKPSRFLHRRAFNLIPDSPVSFPNLSSSAYLRPLVFTSHTGDCYAHERVVIRYLEQTRQRQTNSPIKSMQEANLFGSIYEHKIQTSKVLDCQPVHLPSYVYYSIPLAHSAQRESYTVDRSAQWDRLRLEYSQWTDGHSSLKYGSPDNAVLCSKCSQYFSHNRYGGLLASRSANGFSNVYVPDKDSLIKDAGKLHILDTLLQRLKTEGHRVLIYSQMTRMINILEEYMWHRKHTYIRLDGSSKISDRRDMVADFQARSDIFVFLLSTRAGGLGINLTAADTVIFYDSDWNPTVDQQAMDRAHRLGQTKQVTVYRLICKDTIEERILQRAKEKSEIQRMVMSGGNFRPDSLKPKEVVSLLIDDEEMKKKLAQKQEEKRLKEESNKEKERKRKKDKFGDRPPAKRGRKPGWRAAKRVENNRTIPASINHVDTESVASFDSLSRPASPDSECTSVTSERNSNAMDDSSNDTTVIVDDAHTLFASVVPAPVKVVKRGRGRPRGSLRTVVRTTPVPRRQRGRGSVRKALSAAEIAGAQAGLTAAYAAYGYNFTGQSSGNYDNTYHPGQPPGNYDANSSPRTLSPVTFKLSS